MTTVSAPRSASLAPTCQTVADSLMLEPSIVGAALALQVKNPTMWPTPLMCYLKRKYCEYLSLCAGRLQGLAVPPDLVDELWHQHLTDEAGYRRCGYILGRIVTHDAGLGAGASTSAEWMHRTELSLRIWNEEFPDPLLYSLYRTGGAYCGDGGGGDGE